MDSSTKSFPAFFDLLKAAIATYKKNAHLFISIGLVVVGIGLINPISRIIFGGVDSVGVKIIVALIGIIFSIAAVVAQYLAHISFITTVRDVDMGQANKPVKEIYKNAAPFFWGYLWVAVLSFVVVAGSVIFFIIPAIIVGVFITYAIYSYILEGKKGLKALITSMHYVDGYWWYVFGYTILLAFLMMIIGMIFAGILAVILFSAGGGFDAAAAQATHSVTTLIWSVIFSFVTTCVFVPIGYIFSYSIYKFLKQQKSEPNFDDPELKNRKTLFMVFGIIGILVGLAAMFLPLLILILVSISHSPGFTATTTQASSLIDAVRGLF